ncbi:MAG: hypothetical protein QM536_04945 [Chitinophagaceae bacterium]|nr:hypothetical protein [Chitinophagaceae bacterium]
MKFQYVLVLLFCALQGIAQKQTAAPPSQIPASTKAEERWTGYQQRLKLRENSLVKNVPFRNVGPTIMSGRVVDLEVDPQDATHFYVAFASGGLWETKNNGASFSPLFQNEIAISIGDIAVNWSQSLIYIGSGENNSSRSSYSGYGMFKSENAGKNWTPIGLAESHHIGRIVLHPTNPNIITVAVLGHLYSENAERGIYKTSDGGKTWKKTLSVNNRTGAIDLTADPVNPDVLYAATWEKERKAWNFDGSGVGSGIYKSTDGAENWVKISGNGFPETKGVGRIGLAVAPSNPQIMYAFLDNQDTREKKQSDEQAEKVTKGLLRTISKENFIALDNKDINAFLDKNDFPQKYNAVDIKKDITAEKIKPSDLVEYLEDANTLLFDTEIKGAEMYRSNDGGKTWNKTHSDYLDNVVYTYGYYFGQVRVDAVDPDKIYTYGVPILTSEDGGKTWKSIGGNNVHADHHALWVNPKRSGHLILGNDGGVNISYDNGKTWTKCNTIPVGQFYAVTYDMATPYNVYGGLQDNGVWMGPSTYQYSNEWNQEGIYPYKTIMGGDGMQVQVDFRDNETVYTGYQFGNYYRLNSKNPDNAEYITPQHELGERPLRWNWESPILISRHNQDIIYFGSNKFHRSMDKGKTFQTLSSDLTTGGKKGNVSYGTLTSIAESPKRFGLLYVGTDDGLIHISKDAGNSWEKISTPPLPQNFWVSTTEASNHKENRVYVSLNGYRWDNFESHIYASEDYGKTWKKIGLDLPIEPVNVIREDPKNENLLYVGTDHGAYISLDRGTSFQALDGGLPSVPVHDLTIHPRENDLILGTHGRSIFIGNIAHIQALSPTILSKNFHFFDTKKVTFNKNWGKQGWNKWNLGGFNEPKQSICFYAQQTESVTFSVTTETGLEVYTKKIDAVKGLNYLEYNISMVESAAEPLKKTLKESSTFKKADNGIYYLPVGTYTFNLSNNKGNATSTFTIESPKKTEERKNKE